MEAAKIPQLELVRSPHLAGSHASEPEIVDKRQPIETLLAFASHDLRARLSVIQLALSEALREGAGLPPHARRLVAIAQRSTTRMDELLTSTIDVARHNAGELTLERKIWSAAALVSDAIELESPIAKAHGVALLADIPLDLEVSCDRPLIMRVLSNLIGNALKFTPRGGRAVVWAKGGTNTVDFSVSDTGIGIARADRQRVLEPFVQTATGDQPGPGSRRGSGLGLAIAKTYVEAHGGWIDIDSDIGRWTVVTFRLPVVAPKRAAR